MNTDDKCPHCGGNRTPCDAGPGYVTFLCEDCLRRGREEVVES